MPDREKSGMVPKILVIDDEPDVLEFQKAFLTRRGYAVVTATNTDEAIEAIKNESPDIIFCDVRLDSEKAGLDILEQAKSIKPDVVFYLITGLIDKDIDENGRRLGVREILTKPISNVELEKKIKKIYDT